MVKLIVDPDSSHVPSVPTPESSSTPKLEDTLADYQPPKRYSKKQDKDDVVGPSVFITGGAGAKNLCKRCNKRVYEMEKLIADKDIYHKLCFRCLHCKRILSFGNFASIDGRPYCKPHFIELFKKKGRYDMASSKPRSDEPSKDLLVDVNTMDTAIPAVTSNGRQTRLSNNGNKEPSEELKEEPLHFQQMSTVRNMFETASRSAPASVTLPKYRFAPNKPKEPESARTVHYEMTPQEDERVEEVSEVEEEELPPPATTRSLVARFREMEESGVEISIPDRKPVHKITPPRAELAPGIEQAIKLQNQPHEEDQYHESPEREIVKSGEEPNPANELPPPQFTRHLLAKFQSMEEINPPSISPQKVTSVQRSQSLRTTPPASSQQKMRQISRASPDSGIMDVDMHTVNGHHPADTESEQELPEEGFTRSLVAKWRCIEETSPAPAPVKQNMASSHTQSRAAQSPQQHADTHNKPDVQYQQHYKQHDDDDDDYNDDDDGDDHTDSKKHIIRESDSNEEDFLPPPSFTKNMLAKFQNLEAEAERQANEQLMPTKKHYKWSVKEAPLISGSGVLWQEKRRNSSIDDELDHHYHDDDQDKREHDNMEYVYEDEVYHDAGHSSNMVTSDQTPLNDEELPPQAYTKSMLAKFRLLENIEGPPPTPLHAEHQQRLAYTPTSSTRQPSSSQRIDTVQGDIYDDQQNGHYYDDHVDSTQYENETFHDQDIARESDMYVQDELPEIGTTQSLLSKFQSIQAL